MDGITFSTNRTDLHPKEVIQLYSALGWGVESDYDEAKIANAILNTSFIVSVRDGNNKVVAIARVLSDDVLHTHIAEIGVHPLYRRQGIGTALMEQIKQRYLHTSIYFDSFKRNEEFFTGIGYKKRDMAVFSMNFSK